MNTDLLNALHRYAEDREIDYIPAQYIGENFGLKFETQDKLVEWKQIIDRYLKTFNEDDLKLIEHYIINENRSRNVNFRQFNKRMEESAGEKTFQEKFSDIWDDMFEEWMHQYEDRWNRMSKDRKTVIASKLLNDFAHSKKFNRLEIKKYIEDIITSFDEGLGFDED